MEKIFLYIIDLLKVGNFTVIAMPECLVFIIKTDMKL